MSLPILIWAYAAGPDPHSEGGPGGNASACAQGGCHVGTPLNGGGGKVELQFPNGNTYVPGVKQRVRVVITDTNATTRVYGYQVSARLASNELRGQAGTFTPTGSDIVLCEDGSARPAAGCRTNVPLEFISHGRPATSGTFEFDWTPPATDQGNVRFYVAGNAGNNNQQNTGDRIYAANVTLTPSAGGGNRPVITSDGGITNGASFVPGVVTGAWTSIFGANLASATKDWTGLIDAQGNFPTSIDGVSVTIDGKPAFINFVSANQINVQAPDLAGKTGPVQAIVKTAAGESLPVSVNAQKELPGLFLFTQAPKKHPAAVRSDGVFIGPDALFGAAVRTVPAKPGDIVLFFGTGFGPTNPAVTPGKVFSGAAPLVDRVQMTIGGVSVTPGFGGLSGAGLNQFNVTIPDLPNGEHPIQMSINGVSIQSGVILTIQR